MLRTSGQFVHDLRHRFSFELRPDPALDQACSDIATQLEAAGLLLPGASTAPRFHPHLTLLRAARTSAVAVETAAAELAASPAAVSLTRVGTFGEGRIVFLELEDRAGVDAARDAAVAALDPADVDPLVFSRPWTPHLTIAYAVPEAARAAAIEHVRARLPLHGRWQDVQSWDLDVRPTQCVHRASIGE